MNIVEHLTCKHCNKIYKDPVFLKCCGGNICELDIADLSSKSSNGLFSCPHCNTDLKEEKFQCNTTLKALINQVELHKFKLNPDYVKTLKDFKEKIAKLENIHNDTLFLIYEKISKLKNKIDLDRERAKIEIEQLADGIIKKLNSYEVQFINETKSEELILHYNKLLKGMRNDLSEYEKCLISLNYTDEDRNKIRNNAEIRIKCLDSEIESYKSKVFKHKSLVYEPMKIDFESLFGKLIVSLFIK